MELAGSIDCHKNICVLALALCETLFHHATIGRLRSTFFSLSTKCSILLGPSHGYLGCLSRAANSEVHADGFDEFMRGHIATYLRLIREDPASLKERILKFQDGIDWNKPTTVLGRTIRTVHLMIGRGTTNTCFAGDHISLRLAGFGTRASVQILLQPAKMN